jgi:hypothetical protein
MQHVANAVVAAKLTLASIATSMAWAEGSSTCAGHEVTTNRELRRAIGSIRV